MLKVLREEKKFLLSYPEYKSKDFYLSRLLHGDLNNGVNGYRVRSLPEKPAGNSMSHIRPSCDG